MKDVIKKYALQFGIDPAALHAFISTETGGKGFDDKTGKIIIQFEPKWFKKKSPYSPSGAWSVNGIEVQSKEWIAFNDAFSKNKKAAMESTSIGIGQIMGFNYKTLGYTSVDEMWDDAKKGVDRQIYQICMFIKNTKGLMYALKTKDWHMVATIYNGKYYKSIALKMNRDPYDKTMKMYYDKYEEIY